MEFGIKTLVIIFLLLIVGMILFLLIAHFTGQSGSIIDQFFGFVGSLLPK
jgi:hypothetical protein